MRIGAITMTRGDRPLFLNQCKKMMEAQTTKLDFHFIVDYEPLNDEVDLIDRFKIGLELCKKNKVDFIFVIEDDDYYPSNYIEQVMKFSNYEMVGFNQTIYYQLEKKASRLLKHENRSSLFCTAFKTDALNNFEYPIKNTPYLDIEVWKFAVENLKSHLIENPLAIGIKSNIGKRAGDGHLLRYDVFEPLEKYVDKSNLKFYENAY